jgi:hypothetical protein
MSRRFLFVLLTAAAFLPGGLRGEEGPLVVWAMGEEGKKIAEMARRFERGEPGGED